MKKKFYLALLLIAALCLSAAGMAQANPQRLVGTWEMGDGDGEFEDESETYDATADGDAILTISNVVPEDEEAGDPGTLDLLLDGEYTVELFDGDDASVAIFLMAMTVDLVEEEFDEEGDVFTIEEVDLDVVIEGEVEETLEVDIEIKLTGPNTADVTITFADGFTIPIEDPGEDIEIEAGGHLKFTATRKTDKPNRPSSGGGCNTGAGFGLFLALGALAIAKRAKRKA